MSDSQEPLPDDLPAGSTGPDTEPAAAGPPGGGTRRGPLGRRRLLAVAVPILVLVAAIAAWQMTKDDESDAQTTATTAPEAEPPSTQPPVAAPPTQTSWLIATSRMPDIQAFDSPSESGGVVATLSDTTDYGVIRTFLVVEQQPEWLKVLLPIRPNGSIGWVRAADVTTSTTSYKITIELAAHKVTLFENGAPVLESSAVIGAPDTPTPLGLFFVTDPVDLRDDPDGIYGAFAFGLSGYSDVLFEFAGGPGQIALHGTNRPNQVGQDISNGCIRIPNDVVVQMVDLLPLGTPVEILA